MGINRKHSLGHLVIIAACIFLAALALHLTVYKRETMVIKLHDDQIDIQKLSNEIARFILVNGYGYQVKLVESTIKEVHDRLISGDIDITLEMWKDNNLIWYDAALKKGEVVDLGPLYTGGRQYWIIPRWYAREKNIRTVFDMKKHWRDFTNPEDPSKGIFFNCIFGWTCRDINRVKLRAYGLDRYYNTVPPTSPEARESIYKNALRHNLPVFGYYWEPNALVSGQDWYALEEPPYSDANWKEIISAATDPNAPVPKTACAFKKIGVHKIANPGFTQKAPDAVEMIKKMEFSTEVFNILYSGTPPKKDPKTFKAMALSFLMTYPDQWRTWVSDQAAEKIKTALEQQPESAMLKVED